MNSETKYIGTHGGKGIDNIIDQEDLKRSHQPVTNAYERDVLQGNFAKEIKVNSRQIIANRAEYQNLKKDHTNSRVPFSTN